MVKVLQRAKRDRAEVLREWNGVAATRNADRFATAALRDALNRKKASEKRLREWGLDPHESLEELVKQAL
jgi:predicted ATP-dependent protease